MKLNGLSVLTSLIISSALLIPQAVANTEKVIFQAPTPNEKTRFDSPGTDDVPQYALRRLAWYLADLPKLTHDNFTLNTHIERGLPNASFPSGPETWVLLDDLNPGRRYEARVCWAATQPTSFGVEAFDLSEVLNDKDGLFSSFTSVFHSRFDADEPLGLGGFRGSPESRMLLRIQTRADYFTEDERLMGKSPPVFVHLVLEPCYFGILPHSATFFGLYLICAIMATVSFFIYLSSIEKVRAMKSKGAAIMNEITLGEPDRDGYTSSMNRVSEDMEDGETGETGGFKAAGIYGFGTEGAARSVSRGRTMGRGYWGSSAGTIQVNPRDRPVNEAPVPVEPEAEGTGEPETPGRGTPGKGGGKNKGKGGKKSKPKKK